MTSTTPAPEFEVSEFFMFESYNSTDDLSTVVSAYFQEASGGIRCSPTQVETSSRVDRSAEREARVRIAFKTESEIDSLDDGYKWRKYGKKMLKNSPNPRNYYKCSVNGCPVKKRIERDKYDTRYVITTYQDVHSHPTSN
uniref:WRKY transcription factor n=1 Tax=Fagopyrum tataricum TaxID=62330 RepID=A0A4P9Q362_FAGTA|nr:WRKY transcription factor [Fagopyrum tataricum]